MLPLGLGPVQTSERVRAAAARTDDERPWEDVKRIAEALLCRVYTTKSQASALDARVFPGGAAESIGTMLSVASKRDAVLVVANGTSGSLIVEALRARGHTHEVVSSNWAQPLDLDGAESALETGAFGAVACVHHDPTTGRLNEVATLGAIAEKHGVPLLLDATASFGAEELELDAWNIGAAAGTAEACLHGAPGMGFVLTNTRLMPTPPSSTTNPAPVASAAPALRALEAALEEHAAEGGAAARRATYNLRSARIRDLCRALGAPLLLDDEVYGAALTSVRIPPGRTALGIVRVFTNAGFALPPHSANQFPLTFMIATMGALTEHDLDNVATTLRQALRPLA